MNRRSGLAESSGTDEPTPVTVKASRAETGRERAGDSGHGEGHGNAPGFDG